MTRHIQTKRTRIASVVTTMGGWLVTDESGTEYRLFNSWLSQRAREYLGNQTPAELHFHHGWLHRDLTGITPAVADDPMPMRLVCSWCNRVMSEGRLPTSHGICPSCKDNMDAELTAKYGVDSQGNPA